MKALKINQYMINNKHELYFYLKEKIKFIKYICLFIFKSVVKHA
jgi:hypothetical protein